MIYIQHVLQLWGKYVCIGAAVVFGWYLLLFLIRSKFYTTYLRLNNWTRTVGWKIIVPCWLLLTLFKCDFDTKYIVPDDAELKQQIINLNIGR